MGPTAPPLQTALGATPRRALVLGVALMIGAVFVFATIDSTAKHLLLKGYGVVQVLWARNAFHLALMLAASPRIGPRRLVASRRPGQQVLRGLILLTAAVAFITALRFVPIADAYALSFLSPLLVSVLAVPILGERVGWRRWTAIAVGFIGVLVIVRPGLGVTHPAASLVLVMASCFALYQVLTRKLGASETPVSLLFYPTLVGTLATSLVAPFAWTPVAPVDWLWLSAMGAGGALGHWLLIRGLRLAPASLLAPFVYTQIVWGLAYGYLLFGDLPDLLTLVGGAVIIASGLYVFWREARRAPSGAG